MSLICCLLSFSCFSPHTLSNSIKSSHILLRLYLVQYTFQTDTLMAVIKSVWSKIPMATIYSAAKLNQQKYVVPFMPQAENTCFFLFFMLNNISVLQLKGSGVIFQHREQYKLFLLLGFLLPVLNWFVMYILSVACKSGVVILPSALWMERKCFTPSWAKKRKNLFISPPTAILAAITPKHWMLVTIFTCKVTSKRCFVFALADTKEKHDKVRHTIASSIGHGTTVLNEAVQTANGENEITAVLINVKGPIRAIQRS